MLVVGSRFRRAAALATLVFAGLGGTAAAAEAERCFVFPPAPAVDPAPASETIEGRTVLSVLPPRPKGVIYLFHGTGGSERFALRLQTRRALAPLVAAGYGWVASASLDRTGPIRFASWPSSTPL